MTTPWQEGAVHRGYTACSVVSSSLGSSFHRLQWREQSSQFTWQSGSELLVALDGLLHSSEGLGVGLGQ